MQGATPIIDDGVLVGVSMDAGASEIVIESGDGIESIGTGAFGRSVQCSKLTLSDEVASIEENAFYDNSYLKTLVIGTGLSLIAPHAFAYNNPLTKISAPFLNTFFEVRDDGCLYSRDGSNTLVLGINGGTMKLNDNCKIVGTCAFSCCKDILTLELPSSLTTIEDYAFSDCSGLASLVIPLSVREIGKCAFFGLSNCSIILIKGPDYEYMPNETYYEGDVIYHGNASDGKWKFLKDVTAVENTSWEATEDARVETSDDLVRKPYVELPALSFGYCPRLNRLSLPNSIKTIFSEFGEYAFQGCSNIGICFRDSTWVDTVDGLIPPARHYASPGDMEQFTVYLAYNNDEGERVDVGSILVSPGYPYGYLPTPEYEGHVFDGWYDRSGNKIESTTIFTGDADETLYGRFTKAMMTVCFYDRDGNALPGWPQEFEYGSLLEVTEIAPPWDAEHTFIGWSNPYDPSIGTITVGSVIEVRQNLELMPVYITSNIFRYSSSPVDGMYVLYGFKSSITREDIAAAMDGTWEDGWLTIPGVYINGTPQPTKIQNGAFKGMTGEDRLLPDHIIIGDGITVVGESAFRECQITGVECRNTLEQIGNLAFYKDTDLVTFGTSGTGNLDTIGDRAFEGCSSLQTVSWNKDNTSRYKVEFRPPSSLKWVGARAFYQCGLLKESEDGDSFSYLEHIGDSAFNSCNFTEVIVRDAYIGNTAFQKNNNLEKVVVESGYIGDQAFKVDYKDTEAEGSPTVCSLTDVTLGWDVYHLGKNAFYYNVLTIDLTRFRGLRVFQNWVIGYTTTLGNVTGTLDLSLSRLRGACVDAIYSSTREFANISKIILPDNEFSACEGSFSIFPNVGQLEFFQKSRFEDKCFYYKATSGSSVESKYTITAITIPREIIWTESDIVGAIGEAYTLSTGLGQVGSLLYTKDVSQYACYGCQSVTTVMLGEKVKSIGTSAFEKCTALKNFLWRNNDAGGASIGERAFYGDTSIEKFYVPNCVDEIGDDAFGGCTALTEITFGSKE